MKDSDLLHGNNVNPLTHVFSRDDSSLLPPSHPLLLLGLLQSQKIHK